MVILYVLYGGNSCSGQPYSIQYQIYSTVKLLKLKNKQTLNCCSTHFTFYSFTVQTSSSFYITMIKDKKYKNIDSDSDSDSGAVLLRR